MKQIKQLACTPDTMFSFQSVNSRLIIMGENIEAPFLDYEQADETCESINGYVDVNQDEAQKSIAITVRPVFDSKASHEVRLHLPLAWAAQLTAETNNGSIEVKQLNGKIKATTRNGRIQLTETKGNITAVCANGSVEGERIEGQLDISTANGKVTIREAVLEGGSVKSGNGRISLQMKPKGNGHLTIFSGNGRIKLALPEDGNYNLSMKTKGKISNHLENNTMQTEDEHVRVVKGNGEFSIYIQNYQSGILLIKYEDFDKEWEENHCHFKFEKEFDMSDFLDDFFRMLKPDPEKTREWKEDMEKLVKQFMDWRGNFGRMGEEFSRQFHDTFGTSRGKEEEAIRLVLEMLKEGKISVEEAEKLINALKKQRH